MIERWWVTVRLLNSSSVIFAMYEGTGSHSVQVGGVVIVNMYIGTVLVVK